MNTEAQILAQSHNSFSRRHCRRFLFSPKTPPRQTMILQNKPNFQKSKTNLTLCSEMTYEENCPLRRHEKQTQNKPNFQACLSCPVRCAAISPGLPKPPRATGLPCEARRAKEDHKSRLCKTKPIYKNAKQIETYVQKGLMKHLPRATAEKTKPICKNEKMNLYPCLKMTYENNQLFPPLQYVPCHSSSACHGEAPWAKPGPLSSVFCCVRSLFLRVTHFFSKCAHFSLLFSILLYFSQHLQTFPQP